jgi:phosphate acetyltransferase
MNRSVYIITPSNQSGKSIISLGLMQMLQRTTPRVAFFKPVIEDKEEKDNHIDAVLSHFKIPMEYEEAYAFSRSELNELRNKGRINYVYDEIIEKYRKLAERFDFVLVEGSDFNEETSVFEVDFNASLATSLGIPALLIIKDNFDSSEELVEHVQLQLHSFIAKNIKIIGVFVSRCTKDIAVAEKALKARLPKELIVALIPNSEELGHPTMKEIADELKAHVLFGNDKLDTIARHHWRYAAGELSQPYFTRLCGSNAGRQIRSCNWHHAGEYVAQLSTCCRSCTYWWLPSRTFRGEPHGWNAANITCISSEYRHIRNSITHCQHTTKDLCR